LVLGAGCWVLGAGCRVPGAGCWVLKRLTLNEQLATSNEQH
jgi:hypothetical protein